MAAELRGGSGVGTSAGRGIVTPEAVVLEFAPAGLASRSVAAAIDFTIQIGAFLVLALLVGVLFRLTGGDSVGIAYVVLIIGAFLILLGYSVLFEVLWNGRTPGKAALSPRVVTTEGAPVRFRHAVVRSALGLLDFYLPPFGICATVAVLLTTRSQRLGDLAAGTIVLRQRSGAADAMIIAFPPPPGMEA